MPEATTPPAPHILIADDSIVCRTVLLILLENAGYKVTSARDGVEALAALRKDKFDLAILDNEMPNLDGIGTLVELRTFLPSLPVIVCSGTVSPDLAVRYTDLHISDLFDKPVDPRKLRDKVAFVLEQSRQRALDQSGTHPGRSLTSPGFLVSEKDRALNKPFFAGASALGHKFRDDFLRVREFRSAAVFEGHAGCGMLELAFGVGLEPQTLVVSSPAEALNESVLLERFAPAGINKQAILLVVTRAERLTPDQQEMLAGFFNPKALGPFAVFTGRIRLVLCASVSLNDLAEAGEFNELLLMRVGAMFLKVPRLAQRTEDLPAIARAIIRRLGAGAATIDDAACHFIEHQPWPGDYMQLHRTLELALRLAGGKNVKADNISAAAALESAFTEPLYHELLPAKVAASDRS
jgi:two-component system response regulator HydG